MNILFPASHYFILAFALVVNTACSGNSHNPASAKSTEFLVSTDGDTVGLHIQEETLRSLKCPTALAAAAGMKPTGRVMACAALRTPEPGWALWHWERVGTEETRQFNGDEFALTRTILDGKIQKIRWQLGRGSIGHGEEYSRHWFADRGPNRIEIADFDGDGRDEILERFGGGQQGMYYQEADVIRLAADGKMQFVVVPNGEYSVMDFSGDDEEDQTVCSASLRIIRKDGKVSLDYQSDLFLPDHPDAREACHDPERIIMTMVNARFIDSSLPEALKEK